MDILVNQSWKHFVAMNLNLKFSLFISYKREGERLKRGETEGSQSVTLVRAVLGIEPRASDT